MSGSLEEFFEKLNGAEALLKLSLKEPEPLQITSN